MVAHGLRRIAVWQKDFPASSANFSSGFVQVAVDRYLRVTARPAERWQVDFGIDMAGLPTGETNLVGGGPGNNARYGKTDTPALTMKVNLCLVGSSASAIVADQ